MTGVSAAVLELYLRLHAAPELSGHEEQTATGLADALVGAGFDVTGGVGGHGVVGVLANGPGPTVLLRAELDALPVAEDTGLPYASTTVAPGPGGVDVPVMHACGHDAHVAALAGAAAALHGCRARWRGTVVVVGQPAEETLTGAAALLADGLYTRFPRPDVVLGQHLAPLPTGFVAHGTGAMTAASTTIEAVVHGRGGHAAFPRLAINPVEIAATATPRLHGLCGQDAVVTVGSLHAGSTANVIPDHATLGISVRAHSDERLAELTDAIGTVLAEQSAALGAAPPSVRVGPRSPVNVNDPRFASVVRAAHEAAFGADHVIAWPTSMASEDFPHYGCHGDVPTVYWMVGSVGPRRWSAAPGDALWAKAAALPANHSPRFAPDAVPTLRTGVAALTAAALTCLAGR
jgi:hippurate hydrolase